VRVRWRGETRLCCLLSGVQCPAAAAVALLSRRTGYWAKLSRFVTVCDSEGAAAAAAEGENGGWVSRGRGEESGSTCCATNTETGW